MTKKGLFAVESKLRTYRGQNMTVKREDIIACLNEMAPECLAEPWDNTGLIIGTRSRDISKILICLDVTESAIDDACRFGAELIVAHHPLIFSPLKKIDCGDAVGALVQRLIRRGINVFCMHTNADRTFGGLNDLLAGIVGVITNEFDGTAAPYAEPELAPAASGRDSKPDSKPEPKSGSAPSNASAKAPAAAALTSAPGCAPVTAATNTSAPLPADAAAPPAPSPAAPAVMATAAAAPSPGFYRIGALPRAYEPDELNAYVCARLKQDSLYVSPAPVPATKISKMAVMCGSFDIDAATLKNNGVQAVLCGEIKHHQALELIHMGIYVLSAGHHGTERFFTQLAGNWIKDRFPNIGVACSGFDRYPLDVYCKLY
jgi:dinuclear metal center YbgI/SA1388 family protein